MSAPQLLVTGGSGLVGRATLLRLLEADPAAQATVLVRDPARLPMGQWGAFGDRVTVLRGELELPGLGLSADALRSLRQRITHVIHAAANTRFSQSLRDARRVNTTGTAHLVDALHGSAIERFVFVSTSFVAGTMTGVVAERELCAVPSWVNAYERSKHEAEAVVRASGLPATIARSSTIVCDDTTGSVSQFNAIHQALRVFHAGLAAMLPGSEECLVDLVTARYVSEALVQLTLGSAAGLNSRDSTVHLCAGDGALPLGELLDRSRAVWRESREWKSRNVERPAFTNLATYRLFERSVDETGDARLRAITRGLSTFVPQLAYPKRFQTDRAVSLVGEAAPPVAHYWEALCRHLVATRWNAPTRRAS